MHDMSNTRKEIAARLGFAASNGAKVSFDTYTDLVNELRRFTADSANVQYDWYTAANTWLGRKRTSGNKEIAVEANRAYDAVEREMRPKWRQSRPGAKAAFAGDIETKLRSLISRFGFKPDNISASSRFGVAHVEFIDQKGKATEMVSKLKGAMKQMGVPESAITARENQYPADQDGPAQHIGIVTIDFGQMKSSRPGTKTRMTREQTEEQKAGLKIMSAADPAVGAKIAKLIKEGKPQDQAVAIALDMKRRGEL